MTRLNGSPVLSVVTVCMNRQTHLLETSRRVSDWPHHDEHLILDWSSAVPIRRSDLPDDPRIRLHRVEGERRWTLCRAYNLAVQLSTGAWILKLDADCWPGTGADPEALMANGEIWMGHGHGGCAGQFLMSRTQFERVGGFNERMQGWGFDDKDLRARLESSGVEQIGTLPADWVCVIDHSDQERVGDGSGSSGALQRQHALAALRSGRLHNRMVAAHCPWSACSPRSRYTSLPSSRDQEGGLDGLWQVEPWSVPDLQPALKRSLAQQRRRHFWGVFLALPDVVVEDLPERLLPADQEGRWRIRWWHRLYWYSFRAMLLAPVSILSRLKGGVQRLKGR